MDFQNFVNDIQELNPIEVDPLITPYQEEASLEKQVLRTSNCLRRSIKLHSRILLLINTYF